MIKNVKMSETISGDDAYQIYLDLGLKKPGVKSASFETIEAILIKKGVKIRPKPSDSVSHFSNFYSVADILACPLQVSNSVVLFSHLEHFSPTWQIC